MRSEVGFGWLEALLLKQKSGAADCSVTAGTHAADIVAVSVELADVAAAAIAVGVVAVIAGGDRAANDGGADEAGSNAPTPAETLGFGLRGGGCDSAGNGERGEGEGGNPGLDRQRGSILMQAAIVVRMPSWTGGCRFRFESRYPNSPMSDIR